MITNEIFYKCFCLHCVVLCLVFVFFVLTSCLSVLACCPFLSWCLLWLFLFFWICEWWMFDVFLLLFAFVVLFWWYDELWMVRLFCLSFFLRFVSVLFLLFLFFFINMVRLDTFHHLKCRRAAVVVIITQTIGAFQVVLPAFCIKKAWCKTKEQGMVWPIWKHLQIVVINPNWREPNRNFFLIVFCFVCLLLLIGCY